MNRKRIYLSPPHLTGRELSYIKDALESNWIAPVGPHVDAFELELAQAMNCPYAIVTNSGTSAIHLALLATGVKAGDEVLCSTLTFCASANPIVYCGATPVFIDSERDTWNMDPALLEDAIVDRMRKNGKKPKAILLVHLYGMAAKLNEIMAISRKYGVPLIEDAAESLGSTYNGKALGTFGVCGILSFNGNKIITASAGGALVSEDKALAEYARYLQQEAKEPVPYYEHKEVGYNYRFSNILAALGRSQLQVLSERVNRRREVFTIYKTALARYDGIEFQEGIPECVSNRWLTAVIFNSSAALREQVRDALQTGGVESRPVWKPMHLQPVFKDYPAYANGTAEHLFTNGLCLPSGTAMPEDDIHYIAEIIKQRLTLL